MPQCAPSPLVQLAAALLAATAPAAAQASLRTIPNPDDGDSFGWALANAGDVDLDGVDDLAIATSQRLFLHSGASGELIRELPLAAQAPAFVHPRGLAGLGDLDQDGYPEILVGMGLYLYEGIATVHSSLDGAVLLHYPTKGYGFGSVGAAAGDLDGDGVREFLVSAPGSAATAGAIYAYSGADGSTLRVDQGAPGEDFGLALASLGDVDGDGVADYAAGAPGVRQVRVLSGASGATLHTWSAPLPGFGRSVAALGDVDGDGAGDVAIGSIGRVSVFSGLSSAPLHTVPAAASGDLGWALAALGDVDGDGLGDFAAGDPLGAGRVVVLRGLDGQEIAALQGAQAHGELGSALAALPDLNGDGRLDLAAGAPGEASGRAHVLLAGWAPPAAYCAAKTTSAGCLPALAAEGSPSLSGADDLLVRARDVHPTAPGALFLGAGAAAAPFQGGLLCVQPPLARLPAQTAAAGPGACDGSFGFAVPHAFLLAHGFAAGGPVHAQAWFRDAGDAFGSGLSDALVWTVVP